MRAARFSSNDRLASRKLRALPHSSACAHRRPSVARSWASRSRSSSHCSARSMRVRASETRVFLVEALGQLPVERHELRHPLGGERVLEDVARERGLAERGGVARGRGGDARLDAVGGGDAAPAALERAGVVGRARQQLDRGLHLVFLGERRRDGVALGELRGEAQHLVPGAGAALGAQQHARGGDLLRPGAVQAAQRVARRGEVALLQRQLGAAHQARRLQRVARAVGALEPAVAPVEVAHLVRGARREQRGDAGRRAVVAGDSRLPSRRARSAPRSTPAARRRARRARARAGGARARRAPRPAARARCRAGGTARTAAGTTPARRRRRTPSTSRRARAGRRTARGPSRRAPPARARPPRRTPPAARTATSSWRSRAARCRNWKPRTASRLSEMVGISKLIEVAESCLSCADASAVCLLRVSK